MIIEDISPVFFSAGPFEVRWYGLLMALSFIIGAYYLLRKGRQQGLDEETLLTMVVATIIAAIIGARLIYVLTNFAHFAAYPEEIIRLDRGGLAFHGGLLGGVLCAWFLARRYRVSINQLLDLSVPGIAIGYALVRIANIFNQEVIGRPALLFPFERHPTQIYGALIGLLLLLLHNYLARSRPRSPGELFWMFLLSYSLLRGLIEETFRDNPLFAWHYVNELWGAGFFTLTQLATPPLLLFAWWMLRRAQKGDAGGG